MTRQVPDAPRKQPTQERALGTTTNRIARVAGVSIGSVYQYFPNKESILGALRDRHEGWFWECVAAEIERVRSLPVRAATRSLVSLLIALHLSDPQLHNALAAAGRPAGIFEETAARYLRDSLARHPGAMRPVDPELASFILVRTLETLIHDTTVSDPERLRDPRFAEEVTELVARYLEP